MTNKLHKEKIPFTQIPNGLITDGELSAKAKAIYCYIKSKPNGWSFYSTEIANSFKEGLSFVKTGLAELEETGYLTRVRERDENGLFAGCKMVLNISKPLSSKVINPTVTLSTVDTATDGLATDGQSHTSNTNINNTDSSNTEKEDIDIIICPKTEKSSVVKVTDGVKKTSGSKKFKRPAVDEISAYCKERKNTIDPEAFFDHYESVGWKVGTKPMKNWKACVRTWERNNYQQSSYGGNTVRKSSII